MLINMFRVNLKFFRNFIFLIKLKSRNLDSYKNNNINFM